MRQYGLMACFARLSRDTLELVHLGGEHGRADKNELVDPSGLFAILIFTHKELASCLNLAKSSGSYRDAVNFLKQHEFERDQPIANKVLLPNVYGLYAGCALRLRKIHGVRVQE